ncbi:cysteine desulfurase [Alteribacillus persepolensis]|uniref:Cysteine desulfurase n=1 Tax=Alteribacillus persepolensis TaxID=568899 RepID=A0A1G8DK79_9BACI|nr:cysteine desulfurase family protein [Alteribacillus persepolensis]SDH57790.1 cysteine desulfurase [Alteribacillus persepolensis]
MKNIYADHAASAPVHHEAAKAMMEAMENNIGNPSSIHHYGRKARMQLDQARQQLADSIGAAVDEIILTSGGTEADNLALVGYAKAHKDQGSHIITTQIEHHAVLHTCERLENQGFDVTYIPVNQYGQVSLEAVQEAITDKTILVSVMHGNNEVGTIQPIEEIADIAQANNVAFHTDAVQSYGLMPIDMKQTPVTLMSVSSHKINGPKGIGFLYAKKGTKLMPFLTGGEQEKKRRAGTENVAAAAGFAKAVEMAVEQREERAGFYQQLSDYFLKCLESEGVRFELNGAKEERLPHITNIFIPNISLESFLVQLDLAGIAASSGSACTAGSVEPSHVLSAMFNDPNRSASSLRFSFGQGNSFEEVEQIAKEIRTIVHRMNSG